MASFVVDNGVESTVADNPLTNVATTLNVATGEGTNFPSTFPYRLNIWDEDTYPDPKDDSNNEVVHVTGRTTDALTIVRGKEGTSGVEHALGSRVAMLITAGMFNDTTYGITTKLDTVETNADVTDAVNIASSIVGVDGKTTPVNADTFGIIDSAAANVLKELTWTNIKATLKIYFDTLYNLYSHPNHTGDVTSVADGAQTIASGVVTYAKIQNISATDKLLGRSTAGAGVTEEIACTAAGRAILDDADAAAQRTTLGAAAAIAELVHIWLPVESAYLPATNPTVLVEHTGVTVYGGWSTADFDDTTKESIIWRIPMPDYNDGNIIVKAFGRPKTTPGAAVTAQFDILVCGKSSSESFDQAVTVDTTVNLSFSLSTGTLQTDIVTATATIDPANVTTDDLMVFELERDVGTDDLTGDFELMYILLEYTKA